MPFAAIVGQERAAERIRATLRSGRMPHAFLFVGARGSGRTAMTKSLAKVLMCADRPAPDEFCATCAECRLLAHGNHPDFHEYAVPEDRQQFPVGLVREEIIPQAGRKPVRADRGVFLIRDVECMNDSSFNILLKTLEEPPRGAMFVLHTESLRTVPETIISRCRIVRFPNLDPLLLADRLVAEGMESEDARWLSRRCHGSPGQAERMKELGLPAINKRLLDRLAHLSAKDNFELSDGLSSLARDHGASGGEVRDIIQEILECIVVYYRDLSVAATAGDGELFNAAAAEQLVHAAEGHHPDDFVERAQLVMDTMEAIAANGNISLQLDHLFTELGRRHAAG